jgi:hypothetical protein
VRVIYHDNSHSVVVLSKEEEDFCRVPKANFIGFSGARRNLAASTFVMPRYSCRNNTGNQVYIATSGWASSA